jgi:uncharacterized membrane protein YqjE
MAIVDSVGRLAATLLGILHTRLGLISVEVEEELTRFSTYLIWSLAALFSAGLAVLLSVLLIVAHFWDTYRVLTLLSLIFLFSAGALIVVWRLRQALRIKPRLLAYTLEELRKDTISLRGDADEQR